jgi:DnaJ-class molecular chaperone
MRKTDYYDILGIDKDAEESHIKKAYRRLAVKIHPDKNPYPKATDAFKKVSAAFACLNDKDKRRVYDQVGHSD